MRRLTRRQSRAALVLALIAVLFLTFDLAGAPLSGARGGVQGFFGALYRGTDGVVGPARSWLGALPHAGRDAGTIASLQRQNAELTRQLEQRKGDATTARQVAALQVQARRGGFRIVPARVTGFGASGTFDWTVTLDAGSRDGVKLEQTVISGADLVGRVVSLSATSCVVLLVSDTGSGVGVRVQRTGELGLVTGSSLDALRFAPLDPVTRVRTGDELLSGPARTSTFVPGFVVGRVTGVHTDAGGSTSATVRPAIRPTALDVVGVLLVGGRTTPRPAIGATPSGQAQR